MAAEETRRVTFHAEWTVELPLEAQFADGDTVSTNALSLDDPYREFVGSEMTVWRVVPAGGTGYEPAERGDLLVYLSDTPNGRRGSPRRATRSRLLGT